MKIKDKAKLAGLTMKELTAKLDVFQKDLVTERMQLSLGKSKNLKKQSLIRRDIARIKTIITKLSETQAVAKKQ